MAEAIFTEPNNTIRFADVPPTGVTVQKGRTLDGLGHLLPRGRSRSPTQPEVDVAQVLRDTAADVLVCYLPVGSEQAARHYAQCAIDAGVGVRELPAGVHRLRRRVGEEVRATPACRSSATTSSRQVGATITHRVLTKLFEDRGVKLDRTYQLNFGGNMDFMNMLERERLDVEEDLEDAVGAVAARGAARQGATSTSDRRDHVPWLEDRKWAQIRLEGRNLRRRPARPSR